MFKTNALHSQDGSYVNIDIATGTPGTKLDAADRNITQDELVNAVLSSGQTLDPTGADNGQLARALACIGAAASSCVDSGAVNAYAPQPVLAGLVAPTSYAQMDGFLIFFEVAATNTGAATCDYNGLGPEPVTDRNGDALLGGELIDTVFLIYNIDDGRWEFLFSSASAASGVQSLTGQSGVITIGGTGSAPHISIASGGINADRIAAGAVTLPKLSNSATASLNVARRTIKAWVNFNGVTGAIRAAFNVSSVTKTDTARHTINLSPSFADANYVVLPGCSQDANGESGAQDAVSITDLSTDSFKIHTFTAGSSKGDLENIFLAILGG
jgi:hypothetical protein